MRSIRLIRLALAAALLALAAVPARAQNTEPAAAATSAEVSTTGPQVATAPAATAQPSGLPAQSGPPRTLRAYWHVYAAFTIAWLLVFGYAISLGRRFGKLERELNAHGAS